MKRNNDGPKNNFGFGEIELQNNHRKPVTRRDFLSIAKNASLAYLVMPSVLTSLSQRLMAEDLQCPELAATPGIPVFIFDCAGGHQFSMSFLPGDKNGQLALLPNTGDPYLRYGISAGYNPHNANIFSTLNRQYGLIMLPRSGFEMGLTTTNAAGDPLVPLHRRKEFDALMVAAVTNSDTTTNTLNSSYIYPALGFRGALASACGDNSRHQPATGSINAAYTPVEVSSVASARGLASIGSIQAQYANQFQNILATASNMSQSQLAAFQNLTPEEQLQTLVKCGYLQSAQFPTRFAADSIFPANGANDPLIAAAFNAGFGGDPNEEGPNSQLAILSKLLADGVGGVAIYQEGGCDNHANNQGIAPFQKAQILGRKLARVLRYMMDRGKPCYFVFTTDGAMGWNMDANRVFNHPVLGVPMAAAPGDSDSSSSALGGVFIPGSDNTTNSLIASHRIRNGVANRQVGWFTSNGVFTGAGAPATALDPSAVAYTLALNWAALQGREQDLMTKFPEAFRIFSRSLNDYIVFKKSV